MNQRVTTTEPMTMAAMPVPVPTITPHRRNRCQGWVMKVARKSAPASSTMANPMVRRTPKRSAMAAQKGPMRP